MSIRRIVCGGAIGALCALVALSGLVVSPRAFAEETSPAPKSLTGSSEAKAPPAVLAKVRQLLDATLNDYQGARFQNTHMVVGKDGGGEVVIMFCGMVNAPNRMGGRNGWQSFAVYPGSGEVDYGLHAQVLCQPTALYDAHDYSADISARA